MFVVVNRELHYKKGEDQLLDTSRAYDFIAHNIIDCQIHQGKERPKIALSCHIEATSGYMGLKETLVRITERFASKGMTEDVKSIVSPFKHSILTSNRNILYIREGWWYIGIKGVESKGTKLLIET